MSELLKTRSLTIILVCIAMVQICILLIIPSFRVSSPMSSNSDITMNQTAARGAFIDVPDSLVFLSTGQYVNTNISNADMTVLSFLSVNCFQCMQDLAKWESLSNEMYSAAKDSTKSKIAFVFIVGGFTRLYSDSIMSEYTELPFPVYYDSTNALIRSTEFLGPPMTLLLDREQRVMESGTPVAQSGLRIQYLNHARQLALTKNHEVR